MMEIVQIIKAAGGASKIARALGRSHATILGWRRVPAEHARAVAQLAGLRADEVRPDLYDAPATDQAA